MTLPQAVFGGLALIALSIYFSVGSLPVDGYPTKNIYKVTICDQYGHNCTNLKGRSL